MPEKFFPALFIISYTSKTKGKAEGRSMEKAKKEKIGLLKAFQNNLYVMKLGNEISRSRVIHAFVTKSLY